MAGKSREATQSLFVKLVDVINNMAREFNCRDVEGRRLVLFRLSTNERFQEDKPWKDIFYLRMYFAKDDDEDDIYPCVLGGIGSLIKSQITLNINLVPRQIQKMLNEKFLFSVIAVKQSFAEIKETTLPYYRSLKKRGD